MRTMIVVSLLLFLIVTGCATGTSYQHGVGYTNPILFAMYVPRIWDGKTTEQQIREWFGEPWLDTTELQGTRRLTYLSGGKGKRLDVTLTEKGIVSDYNFMIPTEDVGK